jgi:chemotaxis response regulator CheB
MSHSPHIVVVDDEPDLREMVQEYLIAASEAMVSADSRSPRSARWIVVKAGPSERRDLPASSPAPGGASSRGRRVP